MSKNYELMKVFDCQDMPEKVKDFFFDKKHVGNDCYVSYYVDNDYCENDEVDNIESERKTDILVDWLTKNGANFGEQVIIKHWW